VASKSRWVFVLVAVAALAVTGARAQKAQAGLVGSLLGFCSGTPLHPFAQFGDTRNYLPFPNGGFESGSNGWSLSGGASVVSGNESFNVVGGTHSLRLPAGSSAASSLGCNGTLGLNGRYFVQNLGDPNARLKVQVVYRGLLGLVLSIVDADTSQVGGTAWRPSNDVVLLSGLTNILPLGTRSIQLRFTPVGGDWRIDDVFVDPICQL
jgi:hypothetical protein